MFLCFILATIPNDLWLALKKFYWCHEGPFFLERWVFRHVPNIFLLFWDFYDNYIVFALNKLSFPLWSFYVDVNDSFWAALPLIVVERISSWAA